MKRALLSIIASIALLFLLGNVGAACNSHLGISEFKKIIAQNSGLYEIHDKWDLSINKINVHCKDEISINGKVYFSSRKVINLKAGQAIIIPRGCVFIPDNRNTFFGEGFYEANDNEKGYLASYKRSNEKCVITERIVLPPNSELKFSGGEVLNGIIDLSNSIILGEETQLFANCQIINIGNAQILGRWFFEDNQEVSSVDLERFNGKEVNFGNLKLTAHEGLFVSNAHWKNLSIKAPKIVIGNSNHIGEGFSVWKNNKNHIECEIDLRPYKNYIVLLSLGDHVHYDWREINGKPTLFRGISSVIDDAKRNSFVIPDTMEDFEKEYQYIASNGSKVTLPSLGYIFEPCHVVLDNCTFYSSARVKPGFMYINSGKNVSLSNCSWIASPEGSPSLLGINNTVGGVVMNCSFKGAYYEGTATSYGLQLFGSTRIKVNNCVFEGNRRGLDFSGNLCQSRYCIVEHCKVTGDIIEHSGSGLGGHSTSYANIYRNNTIDGSSSRIGIQTRGDKEVIENNIFKLPFSAATITCVENTIIRNNVNVEEDNSTFVWIESSSIVGNKIIIDNNRFSGVNLVRGQKTLSCDAYIRNNTFIYTAVHSSLAPIGHNVSIFARDNQLVKGSNSAVLYYKFNTIVSPNTYEMPHKTDSMDFEIKSTGIIIN